VSWGGRELKAAMDDIGVKLNDSELDTMMGMADLDRWARPPPPGTRRDGAVSESRAIYPSHRQCIRVMGDISDSYSHGRYIRVVGDISELSSASPSNALLCDAFEAWPADL
jgi:hypothetical protein